MLESKVLDEAPFNLLTLLVAKHHKRGQQYERQSTDNISGDSWGWAEAPRPQRDRELRLGSKSLGDPVWSRLKGPGPHFRRTHPAQLQEAHETREAGDTPRHLLPRALRPLGPETACRFTPV